MDVKQHVNTRISNFGEFGDFTSNNRKIRTKRLCDNLKL